MVKKLGLKLKEQKGFTLIELLAVIVILGIIAAIAIPAISNVISKSDAKAQAQEGVQIINAVKMFVANESKTLTNNMTITRAELMGEYLDRVDAPKKANDADDFLVRVTEVTSGKFQYSLEQHPANATFSSITPLTEQKLVEKAK
ncbi:prepilin-type N-terminal cleavage/methylation domain-containing protein [Neobacillus mesonae]|uniref:Prepilin-type cleavage/methylation domain-containing protein n=1 Tax=Neobacillus mesonae TaxID=1193713 RepID=A0A3Q9QUH5_9BACI|nr:prepilin-type N-terminal cleavage/methylation domain-containing protein [Neobacillus mesonae]AZU63506.1 hypothetical protein CHR53_20780 [Neobacillus mesonae]